MTRAFIFQELPELIDLCPAKHGDIVAVYDGFSAGNSALSKIIRRLDKVEWQGKAHKPVINHVYRRFVFKDGSSFICESHVSGGVQITPYIALLRAIESGKVTKLAEKNLMITPDHMADLWNSHLEVHGKGYDKKMIALYYVWIRLRRKKGNCFKRQNPNKYTCNELFTERGYGYDFHVMDLDFSKTPERLFLDVFGKPSSVYHGEGLFTYSDEY